MEGTYGLDLNRTPSRQGVLGKCEGERPTDKSGSGKVAEEVEGVEAIARDFK